MISTKIFNSPILWTFLDAIWDYCTSGGSLTYRQRSYGLRLSKVCISIFWTFLLFHWMQIVKITFSRLGCTPFVTQHRQYAMRRCVAYDIRGSPFRLEAAPWNFKSVHTIPIHSRNRFQEEIQRHHRFWSRYWMECSDSVGVWASTWVRAIDLENPPMCLSKGYIELDNKILQTHRRNTNKH